MNELVLVLPASSRRGLIRRILDQIYSWAANTMFVTTGLAWLADLVDANSAMFLGIGTGGASDPTAGRTDLFTPATEARVACAEAQPTSVTLRRTATVTLDGSKTVNECGLFESAGASSPPTGGTLLSMSNNFTAVTGVLNDQIAFTYDNVLASA